MNEKKRTKKMRNIYKISSFDIIYANFSKASSENVEFIITKIS